MKSLLLLSALVGLSTARSPLTLNLDSIANPPVHHGSEGLFPDFVSKESVTGSDQIAIGDMLFTTESYSNWMSAGRSYLMPPINQWTKDASGFPIFPYVIDSTVAAADATVVLAGISQWSGTCIKFTNNTVAKLTNFVKIVKPTTSGVCNSYVGNINSGTAGQPLNLGSGCYTSNVVAHEIGHAIGLGHEHTRSDRDTYLTMYLNNIVTGASGNFALDPTYFSTQGVPYNYLSVMHYFWNIFAVNSLVPTMMPKNPLMQIYLMKNNPVSHYDTLLVNKAFNCSTLWAKSCASPPTCVNFGYLGPNCLCVCPPGTSGTTCATKTVTSLPYYPTNYTNFQCGGNITAATTGISSPLFNATYPARQAQADCIWWIQKPATALTAKVTFTAFNMFSKYSDGTCYFEFLEVRTKSRDTADGPRKCATDYAVNSVISSSGDIVLWFQSRVYPGGNTGFTFNVSFA